MAIVNENEFPSLDPTVYSQRKFIEYIKKFLTSEEGIKQLYTFTEGTDISITTTEINENKTDVLISYQKSVAPSGSITQFTEEYGKAIAIDEKNITITVNRKTHPLKEILHPNVNPAVSLDQAALADILKDQSKVINVTNAIALDGNGTQLAVGGSFEDTGGSAGTLDCIVTRRARHFWGTSADNTGNENWTGGGFTSQLGSLPSKITVDHGFQKSYLVIASTQDILVLANGLEVGMTKLTMNINPYAADQSYEKSYNIYISSSTSTGPYTYDIKNA